MDIVDNDDATHHEDAYVKLLDSYRTPEYASRDSPEPIVAPPPPSALRDTPATITSPAVAIKRIETTSSPHSPIGRLGYVRPACAELTIRGGPPAIATGAVYFNNGSIPPRDNAATTTATNTTSARSVHQRGSSIHSVVAGPLLAYETAAVTEYISISSRMKTPHVDSIAGGGAGIGKSIRLSASAPKPGDRTKCSNASKPTRGSISSTFAIAEETKSIAISMAP